MKNNETGWNVCILDEQMTNEMQKSEIKFKFFKNELEDIENESLRLFAKKVVASAPDYFFRVPASSTGKYHPTLSLGEGGLVRHTRLVVWFAENIANAMMIEPRNKDILIVSALVHDMKKHGDSSTEYTVKEHPQLAAVFLNDVWEKNKSLFNGNEGFYEDISKDVEKMKQIVQCHMGQWGEKDGMPLPKTKLELILHTADYLASRKEINDFMFRPTEDVEKIEEPCSEYRITFGKHKGKTIGQFYNENKDEAINYFEWVISNEEFKIVEAKEKIKQFLNEIKRELLKNDNKQ